MRSERKRSSSKITNVEKDPHLLQSAKNGDLRSIWMSLRADSDARDSAMAAIGILSMQEDWKVVDMEDYGERLPLIVWEYVGWVCLHGSVADLAALLEDVGLLKINDGASFIGRVFSGSTISSFDQNKLLGILNTFGQEAFLVTLDDMRLRDPLMKRLLNYGFGSHILRDLVNYKSADLQKKITDIQLQRKFMATASDGSFDSLLERTIEFDKLSGDNFDNLLMELIALDILRVGVDKRFKQDIQSLDSEDIRGFMLRNLLQPPVKINFNLTRLFMDLIGSGHAFSIATLHKAVFLENNRPDFDLKTMQVVPIIRTDLSDTDDTNLVRFFAHICGAHPLDFSKIERGLVCRVAHIIRSERSDFLTAGEADALVRLGYFSDFIGSQFLGSETAAELFVKLALLFPYLGIKGSAITLDVCSKLSDDFRRRNVATFPESKRLIHMIRMFENLLIRQDEQSFLGGFILKNESCSSVRELCLQNIDYHGLESALLIKLSEEVTEPNDPCNILTSGSLYERIGIPLPYLPRVPPAVDNLLYPSDILAALKSANNGLDILTALKTDRNGDCLGKRVELRAVQLGIDVKKEINNICFSDENWQRKNDSLQSLLLALLQCVSFDFEQLPCISESMLHRKIKSNLPVKLLACFTIEANIDHSVYNESLRLKLAKLDVEHQTEITKCSSKEQLSAALHAFDLICSDTPSAQARAEVIDAFESEYYDIGQNIPRLRKHLQNQTRSAFRACPDDLKIRVFPMTTILQSSGMGKSRLLCELANIDPLVYISLGNTASYPARTEIPASALLGKSFPTDTLAKIAIMELLSAISKTVISVRTDLWESQLSGKFWEKVEAALIKTKKLCFRDGARYEELLSQWSDIMSTVYHKSNRAPFYICIDEVYELMPQINEKVNMFAALKSVSADLIRIAQSAEFPSPLLIVTDTYSSVDLIDGEHFKSVTIDYSCFQPLSPFVLINSFDSKFGKEPVSIKDLIDPQNAIRRGRPALCTISGDLKTLTLLWQKKLLGNIDFIPNSDFVLTDLLAIAVLGPTAGLFLNASAYSVAQAMSCKHLMIVRHINFSSKKMFVSYAPEPLISRCANELMRTHVSFNMKKLLVKLTVMMRAGIIDKGGAGELVCRIISIMVRNHCINKHHKSNQDVMHTFTVEQWLDSRHSKAVTGLREEAKLRGNEAELEILLAGTMSFSQFIQLDYTPNLESLVMGIRNFLSFQCRHTQVGIDQVLPVLLNKSYDPPTPVEKGKYKTMSTNGYFPDSDNMMMASATAPKRLKSPVVDEDVISRLIRPEDTDPGAEISSSRVTSINVQSKAQAVYNKAVDRTISPEASGILGPPDTFMWDRPSLGIHEVLACPVGIRKPLTKGIVIVRHTEPMNSGITEADQDSSDEGGSDEMDVKKKKKIYRPASRNRFLVVFRGISHVDCPFLEGPEGKEISELLLGLLGAESNPMLEEMSFAQMAASAQMMKSSQLSRNFRSEKLGRIKDSPFPTNEV